MFPDDEYAWYGSIPRATLSLHGQAATRRRSPAHQRRSRVRAVYRVPFYRRVSGWNVSAARQRAAGVDRNVDQHSSDDLHPFLDANRLDVVCAPWQCNYICGGLACRVCVCARSERPPRRTFTDYLSRCEILLNPPMRVVGNIVGEISQKSGGKPAFLTTSCSPLSFNSCLKDFQCWIIRTPWRSQGWEGGLAPAG